VVGVDQEVSIGLGAFDGVLQTLDITALEPDQAEYKYYAPGVGLVLEQALDDEGGVEFAIELQGVRTVGDVALPATADNSEGITLDDLVETGSIALPGDGEPELEEFQGEGSDLFVTFLGESAVFDNLNPAAGVQAVELGRDAAEDTEGGKVTVLGFEDLFATDPAFDGDYNDAIVAVSEASLGADTVTSLLGELDTAAGADSVAA
jgi:hypothetical protein